VTFDRLSAVVDAAIGDGAFPGAVVLVSSKGRLVFHQAFGSRSVVPSRTPMTPDMVFDLSSLTKPLATTTALLTYVRDGRLRLDDRVTRWLPNFGVHGKFHMTVRDLLAHCSGLAAHRDFWKEIARVERSGRLNFVASHGAKDWLYQQLDRERVEYEPGSKSVYSDLGFMVLGELIELLAQASLDRVCHERVFRPLGLKSTAFLDLAQLKLRRLSPVASIIVPTEQCPWRHRVLCGEVHDDNAYAMGGVAGHAGLFANAADVDALVTRLVACWHGEDDFLPPALVREAWTRDGRVRGSTWALGWDTPAPSGYSAAGTKLDRDGVGHLGFTGTSVWIDLARRAHVVLLTNRVHPSRTNDRIRDVRPKVHDAATEALDA